MADPPPHSRGCHTCQQGGWGLTVSHAQDFELVTIVTRKPFKAFKQGEK